MRGNAAGKTAQRAASVHPGRIIVLGLDLSLTGAGMVAVPSDWDGNFNRIARHTEGEKLPDDASRALKTGRLTRIAASVVNFAQRHECTVAIAEGYAFASRNSRAHSIGELGGVVFHQLAEKLGLVADVVPVKSARKLILGKLPRSDEKNATRVALTKMGMPASWDMDTGDAFVAANWALSALGGFAFAMEAA